MRETGIGLPQLALDYQDLRPLPLVTRRSTLAKLLRRVPGALRLSETFTDAERLLAECGKRASKASSPSAWMRPTALARATG